MLGQPDQNSHTKKVKAGYVFLEPDGEQLAKIGEMTEQGKIRANVGTVMKLEEIQEAHRLSETHHAKENWSRVSKKVHRFTNDFHGKGVTSPTIHRMA
ncbi:zinc-binding dehydrogenase [Lentibacillus sp. CBA3610]|uniref:zinc-binding dehydrogenase n=1 Tax=Lentibacillus sp. CBA3610 TaxID=2518176 RepID=UPI001595A2E4|nr:zinc-binding dehydrogenase [Lentibacillus sp. CBA3610]